jgi:DNA polymerase III subunit gamma/tau
MCQVIARKCRPPTSHDVLNQEHIKTTLRSAIVQNRIARGYVFSGPPGTGKTATARMAARRLNCAREPT